MPIVSVAFTTVDSHIGFSLLVRPANFAKELKTMLDTDKIYQKLTPSHWLYRDDDVSLIPSMLDILHDYSGVGSNRLFEIRCPSEATIAFLRNQRRPVDTEVPWHLLPQQFDKMYDYQREDVARIYQLDSKVLCGHDMGCGKTMISLAGATLLQNGRNDFKTLIITPSYLTGNWVAELQKWGVAQPDDIQLVKKTKENIDFGKTVVISYDLAVRMISQINAVDLDLVIADESHYLKNQKTKRWQNLGPVLKRTDYVLLLTGTPALSRPEELFTQLSVLMPEQFKDWHRYTERYCDGKYVFFGSKRVWDCRGSSNKDELSMLMKNVFIRRLKKDVLTQLPPKVRTELYVEVSKTKLKPLPPLFEELRDITAKIHSGHFTDAEISRKLFEQKTIVSKLFRATCAAKIDICCKILEDYVSATTEKAVFFAVHQIMLDALQVVLKKKKIGFIRIDGSTPQGDRLPMVNQFTKMDNDIQIAILSIGACNSGLNLCPVSTMFFAELSWTPGLILQCEDRLHRIGATSESIAYKYILAQETYDERIFAKLQDKFSTLDSVIDGGANELGFESTAEISNVQTIRALFEKIGIQTWTGDDVPYAPPATVEEFVQDFGIAMTLKEIDTLGLLPDTLDSELHDTNILNSNAFSQYLNLSEYRGDDIDFSLGEFYILTNLAITDIAKICALRGDAKMEVFVELCTSPVFIDDVPTEALINVFFKKK